MSEYRTIFDNFDAFLYNKVCGWRIGLAMICHGLYHLLTPSVILRQKEHFTVATVTSAPAMKEATLIHRRLGHPSFTLLKTMYPSLFKNCYIDDLANAKDFCNHELKEFLVNERIRHETSCPYIPQQNGHVERKIGDSMDKGRTLMIQASLPKILWNFPIMTAVYLINRFPSKVIGLHSPTELIEKHFQKVKLHNRHKPQVFGCVVFIHGHNMPPDKLSA